WAHVRIADQKVESPVFSVIGQRFISSVNDCAIELHPLINVVHDVIRSLADLEINRLFACGNFEIESERIRLPNPARAGENLASGQESEQSAERRRSELRLASHQIILVATESGPGVMIDVVLDKRD